MNQHPISSDEMYKEDPTQDMLDWLQPFTVNVEDLEMYVLAHSSEKVNSHRESDASKVETQKRKHNIFSHFPKTELRHMLGNQNYEGSLQKTHWRRFTSRRKVW